MKDKASKDIQNTNCCANGECCSSSSTNEKRQNVGKGKWWKITALAVGVLLIVAATGYSLIIRHGGNSSNGLLGNSNMPPVSSNTRNSACDTLGISDLNWVKNLASVFAEHDVVFVILQGDENSAKAVTGQVGVVAEELRDQGESVYSMILDAGNSEFSITTQMLGVSQIPAVIILAKSGNGAIVTGNIDETKLLEAYLVVSNPICPPGSSSSCCPK